MLHRIDVLNYGFCDPLSIGEIKGMSIKALKRRNRRSFFCGFCVIIMGARERSCVFGTQEQGREKIERNGKTGFSS